MMAKRRQSLGVYKTMLSIWRKLRNATICKGFRSFHNIRKASPPREESTGIHSSALFSRRLLHHHRVAMKRSVREERYANVRDGAVDVRNDAAKCHENADQAAVAQRPAAVNPPAGYDEACLGVSHDSAAYGPGFVDDEEL